jgi:catechol 2,3-dioxygenase-like lactoylglutathione lyase family enzyme
MRVFTKLDSTFTRQKQEERMGVLEFAEPAVVVCTRDRARATAFYRDTLGLRLAREDDFASVFSVGGITLRISFAVDFAPHEHTILGFKVPDVRGAVQALSENGVAFNRYPRFSQDELGILTLPGGTKHVAFFSASMDARALLQSFSEKKTTAGFSVPFLWKRWACHSTR